MQQTVSQNRLHTQGGHFMHHRHRPTDVIGVGDRYGRHFIFCRPFGKFGHFNSPFQKGISRMHMQMYKLWCHGDTIANFDKKIKEILDIKQLRLLGAIDVKIKNLDI